MIVGQSGMKCRERQRGTYTDSSLKQSDTTYPYVRNAVKSYTHIHYKTANIACENLVTAFHNAPPSPLLTSPSKFAFTQRALREQLSGHSSSEWLLEMRATVDLEKSQQHLGPTSNGSCIYALIFYSISYRSMPSRGANNGNSIDEYMKASISIPSFN